MGGTEGVLEVDEQKKYLKEGYVWVLFVGGIFEINLISVTSNEKRVISLKVKKKS